MDNASYHSRLTPGSVGPTSSWRKPEIIEYMRDNKIVPPQLLPGYKTPEEVQAQLDACIAGGPPFNYIEPRYQEGEMVPTVAEYNRLTIPTLLICIPRKPKMYVTDEMCKANGVEMVRLPPYHCEFNPIELVWARAKSAVRRKNLEYKLEAAMSLMRTETLKCDAAYWAKLEEHAQKEEGYALAGDALLFQAVTRAAECSQSVVLRFSVSDDESSEDESDNYNSDEE